MLIERPRPNGRDGLGVEGAGPGLTGNMKVIAAQTGIKREYLG